LKAKETFVSIQKSNPGRVEGYFILKSTPQEKRFIFQCSALSVSLLLAKQVVVQTSEAFMLGKYNDNQRGSIETGKRENAQEQAP